MRDSGHIDLARVRAETPGTAHRLHFNNAGAALMPKPVIETMTGYIRREAEIGGYEAAMEAQTALDAVHPAVARLIGAQAHEIAILPNATVAWQMAFYALPFGPGDRILTARAEFAANYVAFLDMSWRTGVSIEVVPDDADGVLDTDALERMIDDRVRLIAMTWVPTNGGLINPAAEVGQIARRHRILYLLDACQAAGQIPIDVATLGCDFLTATGRKFLRGPRGTGFLYVRQSILETLHPPMIDLFGAPWVAPGRYELRSDARRFETWENNYAARLGLGAAVTYALDLGMKAIAERCLYLGDSLRRALGAVPGLHLHDLGRDKAAIVSFTIDGCDAEQVKQSLAAQGINVSTSPPSSTPLDATARHLPPIVRASPHYYNSEDELERFTSACRQLVRAGS